MAAHDAWQTGKAGAIVEALGVDRLKTLIADTELRTALGELIAQDLALAPEFIAINEVEQLIRYQRDFKTLLLSDPDQIARTVTSKLLTYATGAPISFADRAQIERIVETTRGSDHGFRALIHAVVQSPPFHSK